MTSHISIRKMNCEEYEKALAFVWNVFLEYEAPDYTAEGIEEFCKSIHDEKYIGQLSLYGAFSGDELVGVIATRSGGTHIALFFVDGQYHRQGIGRQLFQRVWEENASDTMTVNSSPYAVSVYRKLGFYETAGEQVVNGLRFTPMELQKTDCGFTKGNHWFRYRTGGFIIHNHRILFVKSAIGDYYYTIGGGVHLGETSETCVEREILEEAGIHTQADHLAVVCENFFKGIGGQIDGLDCHVIELYYCMNMVDDANLCRKKTDEGENLVWLSEDEIVQTNIKPAFIKNYIHEIIHGGKTIHVIEEIER